MSFLKSFFIGIFRCLLALFLIGCTFCMFVGALPFVVLGIVAVVISGFLDDEDDEDEEDDDYEF